MTSAELPTTPQAGEKTKTARQLEASEKREQLKAISAELQAQRDLMQVMGMEDLPTINEMLHDYYAKKNNITELNTFDQWKDKGYQVRRGEKAFLFWGKPRSKQKQEEQTAEEQTEQEQPTEQNAARKDEYFPICYLFDISQCRKL
ncbi:MAG: ArdC-like ssDNA-binding domain-containing protein [Eubacteriales bacterium]